MFGLQHHLQGSYRSLKVLEFEIFLEKSLTSIFPGKTPKKALELGIVSWNFKNLSLKIQKRSEIYICNLYNIHKDVHNTILDGYKHVLPTYLPPELHR